jgi:hypothetical protein
LERQISLFLNDPINTNNTMLTCYPKKMNYFIYQG